MGRYSTQLLQLKNEVMDEPLRGELDAVIAASVLNFDDLIALDLALGGPGFVTVSVGNIGRYAIEDRPVFRPLQYCDQYFGMMADGADAEWLTRAIVQMSGLHLESLVKRISGVFHLPLGTLLHHFGRRRLGNILWNRIQRFNAVYTAAKHDVDHPRDTHLFSVEDAVLAYTISRQLAASLYPHAHLQTDPRLFGL